MFQVPTPSLKFLIIIANLPKKHARAIRYPGQVYHVHGAERVIAAWQEAICIAYYETHVIQEPGESIPCIRKNLLLCTLPVLVTCLEKYHKFLHAWTFLASPSWLEHALLRDLHGSKPMHLSSNYNI